MENQNKLSVPMAIIIAGVIIGGAVLYTDRQGQPSASNQPAAEPTYALNKMLPLDPREHIRGNPNAPVKIVEYSDLECPYCKEFHQVLQQIVAKNGDKVAWIYRHFPLDRHPKATPEAEASECVARLGGNDKFWQYLDKIFAATPSNNGLDLTLLPKLAQELGIDKSALDNCLADEKISAGVKATTDNGVLIGAQGTPFSVIISAKGKLTPLGGYLPLEEMQKVIEQSQQQ